VSNLHTHTPGVVIVHLHYTANKYYKQKSHRRYVVYEHTDKMSFVK